MYKGEPLFRGLLRLAASALFRRVSSGTKPIHAAQFWLSGLSKPGSQVTIGRPAKEGAIGPPLDIMVAGDSAGESTHCLHADRPAM